MQRIFMSALMILPALFMSSAFAKAKKTSPTAEVEAVMSKYRKAPAVTAKVKKTVVQEMTGVDTKSTGNFYYSKGKLRLDFIEPEKTTLVYDGRYVWLEARLDDKKVQVTKLRTNELKKSKSVITALFDQKDVLRGFKLVKSGKEDGAKVYTFAPKNKKAGGEVTSLEVALKGKDISRIGYTDEVENKVNFYFTDLTRGKVDARKFSYKPPKNAEVTEI
jgi:outer membrane lipoprotein-sorting protein